MNNTRDTLLKIAEEFEERAKDSVRKSCEAEADVDCLRWAEQCTTWTKAASHLRQYAGGQQESAGVSSEKLEEGGSGEDVGPESTPSSLARADLAGVPPAPTCPECGHPLDECPSCGAMVRR